MPSDPAPTHLPMRISAFLATGLLLCLCAAAVPAAEAAKKKPIHASKPVFSVSIPESAAAKSAPRPTPVPVPSKAAAPGSDSTVRKADTMVHHAAAVKDSAPPATAPAKAAVTVKKHKPLKRIILLRVIVFLASIVVIIAAIRFVKKQKAAPRFLTTTRLSVMDKEVQRACRYIEKNFADPDLSLKKICLDLVTGEAFLEALMQRDLGVTVNDFIMHVRINKAKQILAHDPLAAGDAIAQETGFVSGAEFLSVFKTLTGVAFEAYTQKKRTGG
jgi:AraC-like DNA-binding protein